MIAATSVVRRLPGAAAAALRCGALRAGPVPSWASATSIRHLSSSDLPYHLVVGMPALSPTMESGVIAEWNVAEGDSFGAGDAIAEIETDKATIAFEAQDDGVVAKILEEAGQGKELPVGTPILVTVEEEEDVAAFKDYVPEAAAAPPAEEKKEEVVAAAAAPPPPPPPTPAPVAVSAPPPAPTPTPAAPEPVPEEAAPLAAAPAAAVPTVGPSWGNLARGASPIAKTLAAEQRAYIEKYGSTGQVPL
mmetsp:Transcript_32297/g.65980  ORF Transcript_32297/g.65980 Transcript_32297/m.65980 type:complete len:248 (-) Transcript_32297:300-1043(-)